jgi:GT2 family glycosyltransferase
MSKITFCVPTKNNLRYLKNSVNSIIKNSSVENDIVVYVDSDNDGTEEWLIQNNVTYFKNDSDIPKGIAYGYNRCINKATTEVVCMFHADMYMAKGFDISILKYLKPKSVVSATRVEPPLHPSGKEKIVRDFGMYPEDFKEREFGEFVQKTSFYNKNKTSKGIFAPWACYKADIDAIGLHDEQFHSYHEDSDIFNRFILAGYDIIQTWEAYVYHLTCRGGQFQDGIEEITKDESFHRMKNNSAKNYLRKWGSWIKNDDYHYPIISRKYDIGFVVRNCNSHILSVLEPMCNTIYIDDENDTYRSEYLEKESSNTNYNLKQRLKDINNCKPYNDIVVEFDAKQLNRESFGIIQNLSDIITESGEVGEFFLDIFKLSIRAMNTYEHELVNIYYKYIL